MTVVLLMYGSFARIIPSMLTGLSFRDSSTAWSSLAWVSA